MEFKLFGMNMQVWKLHSVTDYVLFFGVLLGGVVLLKYITGRMGRGRDDAGAAARVGKRLSRLGGKRCAVIPRSRVPQGDGQGDVLFLSPRGAFVVRCLGWGYRISGSITARQWRISDAKEERFIPNPLKQAMKSAQAVSAALAGRGVDVPVEALVVFADPFQPTPHFSLEWGARTIGWSGLKNWYKSQPAGALTPETIAAAAAVFADAENQKS